VKHTGWLLALAFGAVALSACGSDAGPGTVHLYDHSPVPAVPDRTLPLGAAGVIGTNAIDGVYWAVPTGDGDDTHIGFDVSQALFGPTCVSVLGADECPNDYGVVDDPHVVISASAADLQIVSVVADDHQNYAIDGAELAALASGKAPAAAAPDGYEYVPFPFLLTVTNGKVTEARQIWVP